MLPFTHLWKPEVSVRQRREREGPVILSRSGPPANNIQAGSGYKGHVVKPAEVRRNDAVGPAATIPY
jgi:hypothetical protein